MAAGAAAVILTRLIQYLAVSVVGGASLFFVYGAPSDLASAGARRFVRLAAGLGVLGVAGGLMTQAAQLGEGPADALKAGAVWDVTAGTGFGRAALARAALLAMALAVSFSPTRPRVRWSLIAALGLAASASFGWTGHGNADDGVAGAI